MGLKNRSLAALRHASFMLSDPQRRHNEHLIRGIIERRQVRSADSVLVSFPKAGRTWLRVMLTHAMQRHLDLPPDELLVFDNFKKLDNRAPSVLFTHLFFSAYSEAGRRATLDDLQSRPSLLLVRQPIDVVVSFYHQWRNREKDAKRWLHDYPLGAEQVDIDTWVRHPGWGLDRVIRYYNEMGELLGPLPRNLQVRYETLRQQPVDGLGEILSHVGIDVPAEVIADAVDHGRFEKMQERERSGDLPARGASRLATRNPENRDSYKARRGKVGGYRDELSAETVAWAETRVHETLNPAFGYGP